MDNLQSFIRKEPILVISGVLAALSCLAVPPSAAYLGHLNWRTLALLFCMMAIVAGASGAGMFEWISRKITGGITDQRKLSRALMLLCFVLAMFITNDVTLVTVVPLTMLLMRGAAERTLILTLVQETIAANLGSMVTPFGNPQNLYLSSFYGIDTGRFLQLMLPYALLSLGLLLLQSYLIPKGAVPAGGGRIGSRKNEGPNRKLGFVWCSVRRSCTGSAPHSEHLAGASCGDRGFAAS